MRANKEKIVEELGKIRDKTIIVEGIKDKRALELFGFKEIVILKKGIFETCEEISKNAKEVVILTDLDSEGKKLYSVIYENLERNNVKVDNKFREFLFRETGLRQIEGLVKYVDRLDN
jgi:5S rRNA maturation endonuclease (ribonuclease M5)